MVEDCNRLAGGLCPVKKIARKKNRIWVLFSGVRNDLMQDVELIFPHIVVHEFESDMEIG